jgi:hypothetical protein
MALHAVCTLLFLLLLVVGHLPAQSRGSVDDSDAADVASAFLRAFADEGKAGDMTEAQTAVFAKAMGGDASSLNTVGLALFNGRGVFGDQNTSLAVTFFKAAAAKGHVLAASNLGRAFAEGKGVEKSPAEALRWFKVGALGGHQGSMYNIGLLLAQGTPFTVAVTAPDHADEVPGYFNADPVGALEWFKAAYAESLTPGANAKVTEAVTEASRQAHAVMCDTIAPLALDIAQLGRVWPAASLLPPNSAAQELWAAGWAAVRGFNDSFVRTNGAIDEDARAHLLAAVDALGALVEHHAGALSPLQLYLSLDNLQEMIGPLAGKDDAWAAQAGKVSEALAISHYCRGRFAALETDAACFNGATSSAISYYRRAGDMEAARRVLALARAHPNAATHWRHMSQTPRVFHPVLRSQPWWDADAFALTAELQKAFAKNGGRDLQQQLDRVIALREGALRTGGNVVEEEARVSGPSNSNHPDGLRRVFTPHIGVRATAEATEAIGAGAWSEFGPLFDGVRWSATRCAVVPLVCDTLKNHWKRSDEVCGSRQEALNGHPLTSADVEMECGSDTIVTILRLRPGSRILPHCGTTNRRLIMHFALRGANGVAFRAGDNSTVLQAWSVGADGAATTAASTEEPQPVGGWVLNYGRGDGHAIVFDDSFEHEVSHEGTAERFVVLVVLAHPDRHLLPA